MQTFENQCPNPHCRQIWRFNTIQFPCPRCNTLLEAPLPQGWSRRIDPSNRVYYVDHISKTTTFTHPYFVSPPPIPPKTPPKIQTPSLLKDIKNSLFPKTPDGQTSVQIGTQISSSQTIPIPSPSPNSSDPNIPKYGVYALLDENNQKICVANLTNALRIPKDIEDLAKKVIVVTIDTVISDTSVDSIQFIEASKKGDKKTVQDFISRYPDIANQATSPENQNRALHYAVKLGNRELTLILLDEGNALPNIRNSFLCTPLHTAFDSTNSYHCVSILVERGALLCTKDMYGRTPKQVALQVGNSVLVAEIERVEKNITDLLANNQLNELKYRFGAGLNPNFVTSESKSMLHIAVERRLYSVVEYLLSDEMKIKVHANIRDLYGRTALHIAAVNRDAGMIKLLVQYRLHAKKRSNNQFISKEFTNVNALDNTLWTALHIATSQNDKNTVMELLNDPTIDLNKRELFHGATPLHFATRKEGSPDITLLLIEHGADVNVKDYYGTVSSTPALSNGLKFLKACESGDYRVAVDVDFVHPVTKQSALHIAIRKQHLGIVKLLLENKANRDLSDANRVTPKILATQLNSQFGEGVVQLFSERVIESHTPSEVIRYINEGIPVSIRYNGSTPLHKAAETGSLSCVKAILEHPKTIKERIVNQTTTSEGFTPLHLAAQNGHIECVRELLLNSAEVDNQENNYKSTALMIVVTVKIKVKIPIVHLLLQHGASLDLKDMGNRTPIDIAKEIQEKEVLVLLMWYKSGRDLLDKANGNDLKGVQAILDKEKIRRQFETPDRILRHKESSISFRELIESKQIEKDTKGMVLDVLCELCGLETIKFNLPPEAKITKESLESLEDAEATKRIYLAYSILSKTVDYKPNNPEGLPDLVNFQNIRGETPLHIAVKRGTNCIIPLLNNGADVFITDKGGKNALEAAGIGDGELSSVRYQLFVHANSMKLFAAIKDKNRREVQKLMEKHSNVNPNIRNSALETPIYVAAAAGADQCLEILLKHRDADVNIKTKKADTPLHAAVVGGSLRCVELLIEHLADTLVFDDLHETPLSLAKNESSKYHEIATLLMIETWGARFLQGIANGNSTELEIAKRNLVKDIEGVETTKISPELAAWKMLYVIDRREKATAIQLAIIKQKYEIVTNLIEEYRVDLLDQGILEKTPKEIAIERGAPPSIIALIEANEMGYKLLSVPKIGEADEVDDLKKNYPHLDLNFSDQEGLTALHYAAFNGNFEVVKRLVFRGAMVEPLDTSECTPLHYAAFVGNEEICKLLIEKKANCEVKDKLGLTPFVYASLSGSINVIRLLTKYGVDLSAKYVLGNTTLHLAAEQKDSSFLSEILESQTNVDLQNNLGNTPLMNAVMFGLDRNVALLIKAGADPMKKNFEGDCPLEIACGRGLSQVVRELCKTRMEISIHSSTAVHLACLYGKIDILATLLKYDPNLGKKVTAMKIRFPKHHIGDKEQVSKAEMTPLQVAIAARKQSLVLPLLLAGFRCVPHEDREIIPGWKKGTLHFLRLTQIIANIFACVQSESQFELTDLLKASKAHKLDINSTDLDGNTVMHLAAIQGNVSIVQLLLRAGVSTDVYNYEKKTPLDLASDPLVKEKLRNPPKPDEFMSSFDVPKDDEVDFDKTNPKDPDENAFKRFSHPFLNYIPEQTKPPQNISDIRKKSHDMEESLAKTIKFLKLQKAKGAEYVHDLKWDQIFFQTNLRSLISVCLREFVLLFEDLPTVELRGDHFGIVPDVINSMIETPKGIEIDRLIQNLIKAVTKYYQEKELAEKNK